ncbi:MAG: tetratricopeptide repeat protein [Caldilineaceae bacterium]
MAHLTLALLGSWQVTLADQPLTTFRSVKNQALLAYLAIEAERPHTRAALAGLLWPEEPEAKARHNLRQALFQLRTLLAADAPAYLTITPNAVQFQRQSDHWLDVCILHQLLQTSEQHAHTDLATCIPCLTRLRQAVDLYRGDFLHGLFVDDSPLLEEWILLQRAHHHHAVLDTLYRLAAAYEAQQEYGLMLRYARRQIELDTLREEAYAQAMRALALSGQRSEALAQYAACRQMLSDELGVPPGAEVEALHQQIAANQLQSHPNANVPVIVTPMRSHPLHNLPAATTSFIGRETECAQLRQQLLLPQQRLLTLAGPGGVGKTRLALAAAADLVGAFGDGVWFVALAGVHNPRDLAPAISAALGLELRGTEDPVQLLNVYLRERELLLVLDNVEQLLHADGTVALIQQLLSGAARVKLLVTSRERLHLQAEQVVMVAGLPVPAREQPPTALPATAFGALQLFVARAQHVCIDFTLDEQTLPAVIRICQLVEGLPLAIELAASWVEQFTCAEIADAIADNCDFLATTWHDLPARHRSLRATFDYSWRLLAPDEQRVLAVCALFHGVFTREAAVAICDATLPLLTTLVNKSLIRVATPRRYSLHELIRHYLAEKLDMDERRQRQLAHARYYAGLAAEQSPRWESDREPEALAAVQVAFENLHAAWQWLLQQVTPSATVTEGPETGTLLALLESLASAFVHFYRCQGRYQEGRQLFAEAQQHLQRADWVRPAPTDPLATARQALLAQIMTHLAEMMLNLSQYSEVEALVFRALSLLSAETEPKKRAVALSWLGKAYVRMGRYAEAEERLLASLAHYEAIGATAESTATLNTLGILYSNQRHFAKAHQYHKACLALFQARGYQRGIANTLNNLGSTFLRSDQLEQGQQFYSQAYALAQEVGERLLLALTLSNLGSVSRLLGNYVCAQHCYEESLAYCREIGEQRWTVVALNGIGLTLLDRHELPSAWKTLQQALDLALTIQSLPDTLDALAALGELMALRGELATAAQVLHFVQQHPSTLAVALKRVQEVVTRLALPAPIRPGELVTVLELVRS